MSRRPAPKYPAELRERAVRMVFELTPGRGRWGAIEDVSTQLGIGTAESLRRWVKQAEIDGGGPARRDDRGARRTAPAAPGERGVATGQRDPQNGLCVFRLGGARPPHGQVISYLDEYRGKFGVEPICQTLGEAGVEIAPSTYYATKKRMPSARTQRDQELKAKIASAHEANRGVYGAVKMWHLLQQRGEAVARCTVERLMGELGLAGAVRGKRTDHDPATGRRRVGR